MLQAFRCSVTAFNDELCQSISNPALRPVSVKHQGGSRKNKKN